MKRTIVLMGLCASMLTPAASALAEAAARPTFESLDTNGDGKLTLEEFKKVPARGRRTPEQMFQLMDTDKDGSLSKAEFNARTGRRGGSRRTR